MELSLRTDCAPYSVSEGSSCSQFVVEFHRSVCYAKHPVLEDPPWTSILVAMVPSVDCSPS